MLHLVNASRDDATNMMSWKRGFPCLSRASIKQNGRVANQAARQSRERDQQLHTAQEFFNIRNDPCAILLKAKEALYPASHIPKSRPSFKLQWIFIEIKLHTSNVICNLKNNIDSLELKTCLHITV